MERFYAYILFSPSLARYYSGHTGKLPERIERHNAGKVKSTKKGVPWELVSSFEVNSKSEAALLEMKIKKRGAERFLHDVKIGV